MDDGLDVVDRAMLAVQVAFVGHDDGTEDGRFLSKKDGSNAKRGEV